MMGKNMAARIGGKMWRLFVLEFLDGKHDSSIAWDSE